MNTTERKMQRLAAEVVGVSCGDILQVRFEVQRLHDEGEPIVPPHEQLLNALQAVKNRHGDVDGAIAEVVRAHCGAAVDRKSVV